MAQEIGRDIAFRLGRLLGTHRPRTPAHSSLTGFVADAQDSSNHEQRPATAPTAVETNWKFSSGVYKKTPFLLPNQSP